MRPCAFVVLVLAGSTSPSGAQERAEDTVIVSPRGSVPTLRAALARVSRGGIILVMPGTYAEPMITVTRPVTINGVGTAIFDGLNQHQIMSIGSDSVTIRGLTLRNVGTSFVEDRAAIKVTGVNHCAIENNRIENGFFGIYLAQVSDCRITGNVLTANQSGESSSGNGIHLWSSREILIAGNQIRGHRDGIYFEFVRASTVEKNLSEKNLRYGLHFMYSDSCRYKGNTFRKNLAGVAVMYTRDVVMQSNTFSDNWGSASYGLLLKEISDAVIEGNRFDRNTVGLVADGAVRIRARNNDFVGNGWAVRLMASTYDGRFTSNNFSANTFDVGADSEDGSNLFSGNYFDGYRGFDLNHDGMGDIPHHPVRLFSVIAARHPVGLILLRSLFLDLLDMAEQVMPSLTPAALVDLRPAMRPIART